MGNKWLGSHYISQPLPVLLVPCFPIQDVTESEAKENHAVFIIRLRNENENI